MAGEDHDPAGDGGHEPGVDADAFADVARSSSPQASVAELEAALAESREAQEKCRRFLADAAHQLRTPMTGIQTAAEILLGGPQPAQRDKLLANLVRETMRASRLIGDLLRLARLEGARSLARTRTDLVALCREEIDRAWSLAPRLDMAVQFPKAQCHVEVDHEAVREILANLLDNARRHAVAQIKIDMETDNDAVVVRVADDGPGLAAGQEEEVFERFVSLDGMGGSGLGLPIARELAQAHGGNLTYQQGAFVLRLPLGGR